MHRDSGRQSSRRHPGRRGSRRAEGDDIRWISDRPGESGSQAEVWQVAYLVGPAFRTAASIAFLNGTFVEVVTALLAVRRRADNGSEPGRRTAP